MQSALNGSTRSGMLNSGAKYGNAVFAMGGFKRFTRVQCERAYLVFCCVTYVADAEYPVRTKRCPVERVEYLPDAFREILVRCWAMQEQSVDEYNAILNVRLYYFRLEFLETC